MTCEPRGEMGIFEDYMGCDSGIDPTPIGDPPHTRKQLLAAALLDAQQGVDALRRGNPLAADVWLKLAIDQIRESGVLP